MCMRRLNSAGSIVEASEYEFVFLISEPKPAAMYGMQFDAHEFFQIIAFLVLFSSEIVTHLFIPILALSICLILYVFNLFFFSLRYV